MYICSNCTFAAYDADTCSPKRDLAWRERFCLLHGDIITHPYECDGDGCQCSCEEGTVMRPVLHNDFGIGS